MSLNICAVLLTVVVIAMVAPSLAVAGETGFGGTYHVKGWRPGSDTTGEPDYEGGTELLPWGEGWKYRGTMGGIEYLGVGLALSSRDGLALSFTSLDGQEKGATLLREKGNRLVGKWLLEGVGNGRTGVEIWIKQ